MTVDLRAGDHSVRIGTPFADVALHCVNLPAVHGADARLAALLSTDERAQAATYRIGADRRRFTIVRAVLRLVLAEAGLGPPECLTIVAGRYGKPELAHPAAVRFNVAHSGDVGLIAVARGREVGVDVEVPRARPDLSGVARRFFTPAEAAALAAITDPAGELAAFHRCWVRKEACIKATGLGLRIALDTFEVGVGPFDAAPRRVTVPVDGGAVALELADVTVASDVPAALAVSA